MEARGIVTTALQRGKHAWDAAVIAGGILDELLNRGVEALAQQAEELAVVLEVQPQHFGDGDDVLAFFLLLLQVYRQEYLGYPAPLGWAEILTEPPKD